MNELKKHYNDLLARYNKGISMMADVKDDKEKESEYLKTLEQIQLEMNDTLMKIGEYTEEETVNGFKIEEKPAIVPETKKEEKNIIKVEQKQTVNFLDSYQQNWNIAVQLSKSDIIPKEYQNKPQNIMVALELSQNMNLTPFLVMQNLSVINGKTSWSGSFCKFLIERTGKYTDLELNYIGTKGKDDYGCYLSAIRVSDNKKIKGPEVTMAIAREEGWIARNKKWMTLQDNMLAYRCQSFFARIYCPEALNGIYTDDETFEINSSNEPKEVKDVL